MTTRDTDPNAILERLPFDWRNGSVPVIRLLDGGEWLAVFFVEMHGTVPTVAEVRFVPAPRTSDEQLALVRSLVQRQRGVTTPSRPLAARAMASFQPVEVLSAWLEGEGRKLDDRRVRPLPSFLTEGWTDADERRWKETGAFGLTRDELAAEPDRPGRRGRGDRFYAEVAQAYLRAVRSGSRTPVRDVAKLMGDGYSVNYVRDTLARARKKHGILTDPGQGQPGGELTEKGRQALEGD